MTKKELQAYLQRDDIKISGHTATWNINKAGSIQGLYTGKFIFKVFLTPSEVLASGRFYRELLGPHAINALAHEDNISYAISQLRYRVIQGPPFWASYSGLDGVVGDVPDIEILDHILEAAMASEMKYRATLEERKDKVIAKTKKAAEAIIEDREKIEEESSPNKA